MTSGQQQRVGISIVLIVASIIILVPTFMRQGVPTWWPSSPIRLGLDLRGGSYLVMSVKTPEAVKSQLNSMATTARAELKNEKIGLISARSVSTAPASAGENGEATSGHTIEFTLLGNKGVDRLDDYMAKNFPELTKAGTQGGETRSTVTYRLAPAKAAEIEKNAVSQAIETIRNRVDQYGVAEPTIQRVGEKGIMVQLPEITNLDQVKKTIGSVAKLEFRLVADANKSVDETVTFNTRDRGVLRLEDEVAMSGDAVQNANVNINPSTNEIEVTLTLNSIGKGTFAHITSENIKRQLAIVLDGVVQSAPVIQSAITGGVAQITGNFNQEDAHQLAVVLRSGALPAPLTFEEERTVGASLGADSIKKGIFACLIGAAAVVVFMLFYYKRSGVLAVGCLVLNIAFLLALLALMHATLTLPGLAGLALTVGMAVDANVIIYERIREELRVGATPRAAIEAGFDKAHWTILDANMTTLLIGIILYILGTGPVRGFAVTLSIGIVTTVFAALFLSHLGFQVFGLKNKKGELSI